MKIKTIIIVLGMLLPILSVKAQQIKPLQIGDTVPDLVLHNVLNYKDSVIRLSDLKDKLVILDFWSTWCHSCIEAFPKMQHLQDSLKDKVQIILVNSHNTVADSGRIKKLFDFFHKNTGIRLSMPIALYNTSMNVIFPHRSVPHIIWITPRQKIGAITIAKYVNKSNIDRMYDTETMKLPIKNDFGINRNLPLFVDGNGGDGNQFIYRTLFTDYIDEAGSYIHTFQDKKQDRSGIAVINYTVQGMLQLAWPILFNIHKNRIWYLNKKQGIFKPQADMDTPWRHLFCYEQIVPLSPYSSIMAQMRKDLSNYFKISVKDSVVATDIYGLYKEPDFLSKWDNMAKGLILDENAVHPHIGLQPVKVLTDLLDEISPIPVIDKTSFTSLISIALPKGFRKFSMPEWNSFLHKYGFRLEKSTEPIHITKIEDINPE